MFPLLVGSKNDKKLIIITGNQVNVRNLPSINSNVLVRMYIGNFVELIKVKDKIIEINGKKGRWAYINTRNLINDKVIKGWIFDYYLGYRWKFKKLKSLEYKKLVLYNAGQEYKFTFYSNGRFRLKEPPWRCNNKIKSKQVCRKYGGIFNANDCSCIYTGQLYKFKEFIWAKMDNVKVISNDKFIYVHNNKLCLITGGPTCQ